MTTATAVEATEVQHVLQGHVVHKIGSWSEWRVRWDESTSLEVLMGLLHSGFQVPLQRGESQVDRIDFYLDLADGHSHFQLYEKPVGGVASSQDEERHHLHRQLSQMAFKRVVTEYFSWAGKDSDRRIPEWLRLLEQPGMLEKILWFLRPGEKGGELYNEARFADGVPRLYFEQLATFAFRMVELGWTHRGTLRSDQSVEERFLAARPQFIKILVALGKQGVLRKRDQYPLDGPSRTALEQIALGNMGSLYNLETGEREHRHPRTLQEAFWAGSESAAILLADQMATEADREARSLRDAILTRAEADRRVEALRPSQDPPFRT